MFDAAGDVDLPDVLQIELRQKGWDIEAVVVRIALQVIHVQNEAASGLPGHRVEELRIRVVAGVVRQDMDDVLEEKRHAVACLNLLDPRTDHVERLLSFRQGQHGAERASVYPYIAQVLAVPRDRNVIQKRVE